MSARLLVQARLGLEQVPARRQTVRCAARNLAVAEVPRGCPAMCDRPLELGGSVVVELRSRLEPLRDLVLAHFTIVGI